MSAPGSGASVSPEPAAPPRSAATATKHPLAKRPSELAQRHLAGLAPKRLAGLTAERPVAFFLHGIGDALLALPALRALAELFPGRLAFACDEAAREVLASSVRVGRFVPIEPAFSGGSNDPRTTSFDAEALAARLGGCDLFVSLVPWRSPSLERLLARLDPRMTIGMADGYDTAVRRSHNRHAFDFAFALPRALDPSLEVERFAGPPALDAAAVCEAEAILELLPPGTRVLAVHVESTERKSLSEGWLQETLDGFLSSRPDFWALTLGARPRPGGAMRAMRVAPCEGLALAPSMALVRSSVLFLGVDSCMLHAADLFRTPAVALFGPTRASEFGVRFAAHRVVDGGGSMAAVAPAAAADALGALLAEGA